MSIYNYFINFFVKKTDSNNLNYNVDNLMNLYKIVTKYFNVDFVEFNETIFVLNNFKNINKSLVLSTIILFLFKQRTGNLLHKCLSLVKNNSIIYFFNSTNFLNTNLVLLKFNNVVTKLTTQLNSNFIIRYSPTTAVKYLTSGYLNLVEVLFLRKNKVFNKGRYSRNRQFYRTGVYWCLYINIIAIVGLYFWFYRFVMNFGYLWWLLYLSLGIFILSKSFNYDLVTPNKILTSIKNDLYFFSLLFMSTITWLKKLLSLLNKSLFNNNFLISFNIFNVYTKNSTWLLHGLLQLFLDKRNLFIYLWGYSSVNYYIHSITLKHNRFFLDSKKYKFFSEFINMILK